MITFALSLTLVAQTPGHDKEKKASDEITISAPLMIGGQTLAPGKYRVACNETEISFTRVSDNEKVLTLPCKGKDMGKRAENTEIHTSLNPAGKSDRSHVDL